MSFIKLVNLKTTIIFFFFFCFQYDLIIIYSQEKKVIEAIYISQPIKIDGILDEEYYKITNPAKDFLQIQPYNGKPSYQQSYVYIFYDNKALYVGAMLYDTSPDSIFNYVSERDNTRGSDYFGVYLDPYNEGQLAYGFFVTPSGTQIDLKAIKKEYDYEDNQWNAVWESKTRIIDSGWVVEMRIPFTELRFPKKKEHTWGINFFRYIARYNSNSSWNLVNSSISGFIHQSGILKGINNITPPIRLSFTPYLAVYSEIKKPLGFIYKGGIDLKYGINESFTLDMMLIPDFGQVISDDKRLNLSPYEVYYSEKRQFFMEGIELFQRANIFYSRRIGGYPKFYWKIGKEIKENEIVIKNPTETQIINSTKVSGRTKNGWGIGLLNSITNQTYATLLDTLTETNRKILIQPLTNYNISVIDKTLKNNSYFSIINTNVKMFNNPFFANVLGNEFQIRDKSKSYALTSSSAFSYRNDTIKESGFYTNISIDKNKGKLTYGLSQYICSDKYNPNDLGYLQKNNEISFSSYISYRILQPYWVFREYNANIWLNHARIYKPSNFQYNMVGIYMSALFANNYWSSFNFWYKSNEYDYYEPRIKNRFYIDSASYYLGIGFSSDGRKKIGSSFYLSSIKYFKTDQKSFYEYFSFYVKIGTKFRIQCATNLSQDLNNRGFVDIINNNTIYFAKRDVLSIENIITSAYTFNSNLGISIRCRHYWSGVNNKFFYILQDNGTLKLDPEYNENYNQSYNTFNIDMIFRWIFAPGSEILITYKNSIFYYRSEYIKDYWYNFKNTLNTDQINSLSFKILYYFDYQKLKIKN